MEPLEPAEEAFDLVAVLVHFTAVLVRIAPVGLGRNDWLVAEFARQASGPVVVGADHGKMRLIAGQTERA